MKSGDIIFFDWGRGQDSHADHVEIVEKVDEGTVYPIEGNSDDAC
nr:CHAP domain-containing protein [Clostridium botulinum]